MKTKGLLASLLSSLLLFLALALAAPGVKAEEYVFESPQYQDDIASLREQYRSEVLAYERVERAFYLSRNSYLQLQTLQAFEDAIEQASHFGVERDRVLITYTQLLRLNLLSTFGIPLEDKEEVAVALQILENQLRAHQAAYENVFEQESVIEQDLAFLPLSTQIQALSERSRELIRFGRLQTVFDKASAYLVQAETKIASIEDLQEKRVQERRLGVIQGVVETIAIDVAELEDSATLIRPLSEQRRVEAEQRVYSQLYRLLDLMQELGLSYEAV